MRIIWTLAVAGTLLSAATMSGAHGMHKATAKQAIKQYIVCPITHDRVLKSKAIKVTAANGKSTYVCCKDCTVAAKKQLMTKK